MLKKVLKKVLKEKSPQKSPFFYFFEFKTFIEKCDYVGVCWSQEPTQEKTSQEGLVCLHHREGPLYLLTGVRGKERGGGVFLVCPAHVSSHGWCVCCG